MKRQERGRDAEERARVYLEEHGLCLLARNYRCRFGEIDLIMQDGDALVFVEVRLRTSLKFGGGLTSVDGAKRNRLIATAQHYLQARRRPMPARFDVIAIDSDARVEWVKNAFDANN